MALTAEEWPQIHFLVLLAVSLQSLVLSLLGWWGWSRPLIPSPSLALTRLELSAGHGAAGLWDQLATGGSQVASNFYRGFWGWLAGWGSLGSAAQTCEHPRAAGSSPELGCAGICSLGMQPGMAAQDPGRAVLQGIRPHRGWQGAGKAWWRVQHPSLFTWVLPHCPLGLHVPERSDVLVGGHLLHLQPLIGVVILWAFLLFTLI